PARAARSGHRVSVGRPARMIPGVSARKPQSFSADDPAIVAETDPVPGGAGAADGAGAGALGNGGLVPPTLGGRGERGLRWGKVLIAALAGAAILGTAATFARLVSAALVREDWIGWMAFSLLIIAALAAAMMLLREGVGLSRLARLNRLRAEVARALSE